MGGRGGVCMRMRLHACGHAHAPIMRVIRCRYLHRTVGTGLQDLGSYVGFALVALCRLARTSWAGQVFGRAAVGRAGCGFGCMRRPGVDIACVVGAQREVRGMHAWRFVCSGTAALWFAEVHAACSPRLLPQQSPALSRGCMRCWQHPVCNATDSRMATCSRCAPFVGLSCK